MLALRYYFTATMTYFDKMTPEEVLYVQQRYEQEKISFRGIMKVLAISLGIFTALIIFCEKWYNVGREPKKQIHQAVPASIVMIGLYGFIGFTTYYNNTRKWMLDAQKQEKIIETVEVLRTEFFPPTNKVSAYLSNRRFPIIDITKQDFENIKPGDQINIEYAAHSKTFFSYF